MTPFIPPSGSPPIPDEAVELSSPFDDQRPESLELALSGGGLSATLFHLGIFAYLAHKNRLKDVKGIVSVSGGSILAAQFGKEWQTAISDAKGFVAVAAKLV